MKLHNIGLCDYCGETETVGHFFVNCTENLVARNIKDGCEKLQLDHSRPIKSVINDERLFDVILANINRKI